MIFENGKITNFSITAIDNSFAVPQKESNKIEYIHLNNNLLIIVLCMTPKGSQESKCLWIDWTEKQIHIKLQHCSNYMKRNELQRHVTMRISLKKIIWDKRSHICRGHLLHECVDIKYPEETNPLWEEADSWLLEAEGIAGSIC